MKFALGPLVTLAAVLAAAPQRSATQLPTFRAGVDAVQLDVSVLDADHHPVRGLTAADFTIFDDGKVREIVAFSAIELPAVADVPLKGVETVEPDVARNDAPRGRLVVILIDPYLERIMVPGRVSIADPPGITALRATARRVVDNLGPGDLAAIGHTVYGTPQNFTSDKTRLKRAVDTTEFGKHTQAAGSLNGDCLCGVCRLEAITRVANALRDEPERRKAIFYIGERVQLPPVRGFCNGYVEPAARAMLLATQLANVTVHAVDPNALETTNVHAGDDFEPSRPISEAAAEQERANRAFLIERHQSLQTLADATGGRAILNTNAPEASVRPILDESSSYYLLAFQAADVKLDGRFHPITVTVNRPGVVVRTRKGFYADAVTRAGMPPPTASLEQISQGLLPQRGLSMNVAAAAFRGNDGKPVVVIASGVRAGAASEVRSAPRTAPQFEPIEILTTASRGTDKDEKDARWQRQQLSIAVPDAPPGGLKYESVSTLALDPGSYEVRVATRHEHAGLVGSVHTFVDVPDFDEKAMTLSGLVLFDRNAPTATPSEALSGVLEAAPTTRREFTAGADVTAFARAYRPAATTGASLVIRILDRELHEVASAPIALPAYQLASPQGADIRYRLPLETLRAGQYVLRLDTTDGGNAGRRELRFEVR